MNDQLSTTGALSEEQIQAARLILNRTPIMALASVGRVETFDDVLTQLSSVSVMLMRVMAENEALKDEKQATEQDLKAAGRILRRIGLAVEDLR